jgi:hypothetical protein
MEDLKMIAKNVTLMPEQEALVETIRKQQGLDSFSAALRWILHRFQLDHPAAPQALPVVFDKKGGRL